MTSYHQKDNQEKIFDYMKRPKIMPQLNEKSDPYLKCPFNAQIASTNISL